MSTTYGTASSITIPSDGDTIDAADVNTPFAAVWDQHDVLADTAALTAILVPTHGLMRYVRGYGHYVFVTSGTYSASTAVSPWILASGDGTAGRWVLDLTSQAQATVVRSFGCADASPRGSTVIAKTYSMSGSVFWHPTTGDTNASDLTRSWYYFEGRQIKFPNVENGSASGRHLAFPLNPYLLHGATLVSAKVNLFGSAHVSLPSMMPALAVTRFDPSSDTSVSLYSVGSGLKDDASASIAAYDALHSIALACDQNNTIDLESYLYYAIVCNEGNTNALAELALRNIVLTMTAKGFF
jgi:hypothetical protein